MRIRTALAASGMVVAAVLGAAGTAAADDEPGLSFHDGSAINGSDIVTGDTANTDQGPSIGSPSGNYKDGGFDHAGFSG
ncbi:hypothetical protein [Streptomyces sp. ODS28]|uniref:hypothetical protein n=1 Tax=Streptomyces sp. ODS28 TaxID=3136688 RepID=UPI0031ECCF9E